MVARQFPDFTPVAEQQIAYALTLPRASHQTTPSSRESALPEPIAHMFPPPQYPPIADAIWPEGHAISPRRVSEASCLRVRHVVKSQMLSGSRHLAYARTVPPSQDQV